VTSCGGTCWDSSRRKRGGGGARQGGTGGDTLRRRHNKGAAESARDSGVLMGGAPVIFGALSSCKGANGGVRRGSHWSGVAWERQLQNQWRGARCPVLEKPHELSARQGRA
jgi:hypothetical protein